MKTSTTSRFLAIIIVAAVCFAFPCDAQAKLYKQVINGREVVVHTNPIPVVLHRMVPPQYGRHVTKREVEQGKVPSGRLVNAPQPKKK